MILVYLYLVVGISLGLYWWNNDFHNNEEYLELKETAPPPMLLAMVVITCALLWPTYWISDDIDVRDLDDEDE